MPIAIIAYPAAGGGGGSGTVTSVSSADTSIAVTNPTTAVSLKVATLDVLATNEPPIAAVPLNAQKITGLANGSAASDAAAFGQIPTALPPNGAAGGDLAGTYPSPTIGANKVTVAKLAAAVTLDAIAAANATGADISMNTHKLTNVTDPSGAQDAATKHYVDSRVPATRGLLVVLDTPDASGNGFPALSTSNGFSVVRRIVPAFINALDGTWEGNIVVPADYSSAGAILVSGVCNANSGAVRLRVSTSVIANGASEDGAYTDEAYVNHTVPGTALFRDDVTFTLATTPVAGRTLNVKVTRNGSNGGDTLAVAYLLWDVSFQYTPT